MPRPAHQEGRRLKDGLAASPPRQPPWIADDAEEAEEDEIARSDPGYPAP
ncbi:hypothetical protein [Methanoculleus frigidifontis]|nr:hypothetical protein [Methanoculleus sp. FWC-SCC1]